MRGFTRSDLLLDVVVFISGTAVMIFEITGSRIVSPFMGASTFIWTSLIGVILGALSIGYWLGGRTADRVPKSEVLAAALVSASALIALTTLVKDVVLIGIGAMGLILELKAVIASVLLFAPASVALGFVTPYAVRLRMNSVEEAGRTVGRLYALSTIGSIVGTFAAGFFFLPSFGSTRTLYLVSAVLLVASFLLAPFALNRRNMGASVILVVSILANETTRFAMWRSIDFEDIDTEHNRVHVFRSEDPSTGRAIVAMTFDPYSTQSAMFEDSDELVFEYTKFYHLARVLNPDFRDSLMIGGAGYSFPKSYLSEYPDARLDVVELDRKLTEIAYRRFRLTEDPRLRIIHEDGRVFLNNLPAETYDVVFIDAFGSLFSVPFQLTTIEAARRIRHGLRPDGVAIFNIGSAVSGGASGFLRAELRTYMEVFPSVYLFKVHPNRLDEELQNLIVAACLNECVPPAGVGDDEIDLLLSRRIPIEKIPLDLPVLTDDHAPVERYSSIAHAHSK